ncbi:hypothetical protein EYF80_009762 [Liparis tanakae]|uniref:Uncharacterized protein n=1 Tax=Liparis tanakae TaxID=230148 RepID=A0A4Z2IPW8_9TELE|nr:hypothetical protein EYF80_009762 [Liparis tanakae]
MNASLHHSLTLEAKAPPQDLTVPCRFKYTYLPANRLVVHISDFGVSELSDRHAKGFRKDYIIIVITAMTTALTSTIIVISTARTTIIIIIIIVIVVVVVVVIIIMLFFFQSSAHEYNSSKI